MKNHNVEPGDPRLTAYAVGEMTPDEMSAFEAELANAPAAQREIERIRETADQLRLGFASELELALGNPPGDREPRAKVVAFPEIEPPARRNLIPRCRMAVATVAAVLVASFVVAVQWWQRPRQFSAELAMTESQSRDDGAMAESRDPEVEPAGIHASSLGVSPRPLLLPQSPEAPFFLASAVDAEWDSSADLLENDPIFAAAVTLAEDPVTGRVMFVPRYASLPVPVESEAMSEPGGDHPFGFALRGLDPVPPSPRGYIEMVEKVSADEKGQQTRSVFLVNKSKDGEGRESVRVKGRIQVSAPPGGTPAMEVVDPVPTEAPEDPGGVVILGNAVELSPDSAVTASSSDGGTVVIGSGEGTSSIAVDGNVATNPSRRRVVLPSPGIRSGVDRASEVGSGNTGGASGRAARAIAGAMPGRVQEGWQAAFRSTGSRQPSAVSRKLAGRGRFASTSDNPFFDPLMTALSTFSMDVDTASYTQVRRAILTDNVLPDRDQVRVEEFINYFDYPGDPAPDWVKVKDDEMAPVSVTLECASAPWNPDHRVVRIGMKGAEVPRGDRPAANLVFLIDVSGSMRSGDKLPLIERCLRELVSELREEDRITVVGYASDAGEVLEPTPGSDRERILEVVDALTAKGETNGESGIRIAYQRARENFIEGGINRVLLATDGDFNVGQGGDEDLVGLVEKKAASGIELTVLGVGKGNLNDSLLEKITNRGNGQYHYLDRFEEGRRVLVEQVNRSIVTVANDVKLQVEFNAGKVAAYRLIGYSNRVMSREDFNDDSRDAGDIGAGHTVSALYEVVPIDTLLEMTATEPVDELKYKKRVDLDPERMMSPLERRRRALKRKGLDLVNSPEMLTVKVRYKHPDSDRSQKLEFALVDSGQEFDDASDDFRFATAVGAFGEWLRSAESPNGGRTLAELERIGRIAREAVGGDELGLKREFVRVIETAAGLEAGRISQPGLETGEGDVETAVREKPETPR